MEPRSARDPLDAFTQHQGWTTLLHPEAGDREDATTDGGAVVDPFPAESVSKC